jgi:photosystem II stability/assembly factor-like uncharacterized protein
MTCIRGAHRAAYHGLVSGSVELILGAVLMTVQTGRTHPAQRVALSFVRMVTPAIGWAITERSVLRTTNGGILWSDVTPRGYVPCNTASTFLDGDHAWLAEPQHNRTVAILHTGDGGHAWQRTLVPLTMFWTTVERNTVVDVFVTRDGGKRWMSTALLDTHSPCTCMNLVDFVGTQDGWAFLGATSRLYATKDGARHWRVIASHLQLGSLQFVTRRIGFALAGPFHQGYLTLLRTIDGGHTWTALHPHVLR